MAELFNLGILHNKSSTFKGYLQVGNATYSSDWVLNVSGKGYIGATPNASGAILI